MSALPSYALAPLPAALAPGAWQDSAACRFEDRDLFFPPDEERGRYAGFREAAAKQICRSCPVAGECLDYALRADERYGVWGGMSAEERERVRRRRRARGA
ncbi:MAG TPA: WhiB family transcriptional regulator [Mycobacteriales bacterium]|nr:WhiB family transcriptional regulator [Mycobacteriales bacterium]